MATYEVNADGNRSYRNNNAYNLADVAIVWKKRGLNPKAYVILDTGTIEIREVSITTKLKTAKAMTATRRTTNEINRR